MLRTVDLTSSDAPAREYRARLPRAEFDVEHAVAAVRPICDAVAERGADALREFSEKFDHVVPESFRVDAETLARCAAELPDDLRVAFEESIRRRRFVCADAEAETPEAVVELAPGASVTNRVVPVERVGLYVPGGLAPLASSVIMNVVPAQVAGVRQIAVASPPQAEFGGLPHPNILALCHLLGVTEVYAVGGAQAIAMFAHGVDGVCDPVDLVTGPGNIYVVAAKRLLRGFVGIDSEAGPTEIAVLADDSAVPAFVAADLVSQAEHDPMAASVLVTPSPEFAAVVDAEVERQAASTRYVERVVTALTGPQSAIVLVRDIEQGLDVVNAYAAEHLEVQTRNSAEVAARVRNAGAVFVGSWAPVSLGDYSAGSTHVLPTAGAARHSSGLTVRSFKKVIHVIDYSQAALAEVGPRVEVFARAEQLQAHCDAISVRLQATTPGGAE